MALELNGTTGVSLVQDGVVTAADLSSTLDLSGKTVTLPAANSPGLKLVTSGTCADTQTLNVDNCFTSTYLNYKIHLNLNLADFVTNDQDLDFNLRFRSGGSTITTGGSYRYSMGYKNLGVNAQFDYGTSNSSSLIKLVDNIDSGNTHAVGWFDVYAPASTDGVGKTYVLSELYTQDNTNDKIMWSQGVYTVDAAVDGFALSTFNGNGNFDGTYQIYGYAL